MQVINKNDNVVIMSMQEWNEQLAKANETGRTTAIKEIHTQFTALEPQEFRNYLGKLWWNIDN